MGKHGKETNGGLDEPMIEQEVAVSVDERGFISIQGKYDQI